MKFARPQGPHWLGNLTVPAMMQQVIVAMLPVIGISTWCFGPGILINLAWSILACLLLEAAALRAQGKALQPFVTDGSAVVTAMLIALALPPMTPWWVTLTACLFAIIFAKHLYGGLGQNPFNPAMAGYVVALVAFPEHMANWSADTVPAAGLGVTLDIFLRGDIAAATDALSGATPLDDVRTELAGMRTMNEILAGPGYGLLGGTNWQWINIAALGGGLWLLYRGIIRWHIPAAMLATLTLLYTIFYFSESATNPSPLLGLFSGGTMLAAFFVATDPVSASTTERGKLIYGAGIGILCFAIRKWGAYPDGIGFAILLMNMCAPLIDRYTLPRVYGHRKRP